MKEEVNQKISQFLDDELDHSELDNLLHIVKKQPELKQKMQRYQLANQMMKLEQTVQIDIDFSNRINQQLQNEVHHFLPIQQQHKASFKLWQKASLAAAASVAFVAFLVSQQTIVNSPLPATATAPIQLSQNKPLPAEPKQLAKVNQHERLKAYLQAHNNDLYTHGNINIRPMVRVASYGRD